MPSSKKDLLSFCDILNYLSSFLSMTAEVGEPLQCLTSIKKCNGCGMKLTRDFMASPKQSPKRNICMKAYDAEKLSYIQTDALVVGLVQDYYRQRTGWIVHRTKLQTIPYLTPSHCKQESIQCWKRYSNIEWEVLDILHSLDKFHHYCFTREVCKITDHKAYPWYSRRMWQCYHKDCGTTY